MANMWSFCFIISFHNFATLGNRLTYHCPSSWPVVITMKKKLATTWKKKKKKRDIGRSKWMATVCKWWNPEETGRNCEGADFSWLSSKVSRTQVRNLKPQHEIFHIFNHIYFVRMVSSSTCAFKLSDIWHWSFKFCGGTTHVNGTMIKSMKFD